VELASRVEVNVRLVRRGLIHFAHTANWISFESCTAYPAQREARQELLFERGRGGNARERAEGKLAKSCRGRGPGHASVPITCPKKDPHEERNLTVGGGGEERGGCGTRGRGRKPRLLIPAIIEIRDRATCHGALPSR